jgi:hypothetical protein
VVAHKAVKRILRKKLLQNANGMFSMPVDRIIYAYSEHQPMLEEMEQTIPNLSLHQGLPTKEDIEQYTEGVLHCLNNLFFTYVLKTFESFTFASNSLHSAGLVQDQPL